MKCYCPDCVYSEYNPQTGKYYCGIQRKEYSGSDSRNCNSYKEK